MRNLAKSSVLLVVAIGLVGQMAIPAPVFGQTALEWIVVDQLTYSDFQLQDRPARIVDSGYSMDHLDFVANGTATLSSEALPELDGTTIRLQQVFAIARVGECGTRLTGHTVGTATLSSPAGSAWLSSPPGRTWLSLQSGDDLSLRFRGVLRGMASTIEVTPSGDKKQRIELTVDATTERGHKLTLEVAGLIFSSSACGTVSTSVESLQGTGVLKVNRALRFETEGDSLANR